MSLAIYPLDPSFPRGYVLPRDSRVTIRAADRMAHAKRFTDAEIAAEFWRARQRWTNGLYTNLHATEVDGDARAYTFRQITRMTIEAQTLERFATMPHYDEVTS